MNEFYLTPKEYVELVSRVLLQGMKEDRGWDMDKRYHPEDLASELSNANDFIARGIGGFFLMMSDRD